MSVVAGSNGNLLLFTNTGIRYVCVTSPTAPGVFVSNIQVDTLPSIQVRNAAGQNIDAGFNIICEAP